MLQKKYVCYCNVHCTPWMTQAFSQVNPITAAFYDAVQMYAWALNKTIEDGGDPKDGRIVMTKLWNKTFLSGNEFVSLLVEVMMFFFIPPHFSNVPIVSRAHG